MAKRLLVVLVALSMFGGARLWAEEGAPKKASPVKPAKVTEARIHEGDMSRLETVVSRAVKEAVIAKQGPSGWEYMAKKMKPPKNDKWIDKWNEMGADGWEAIDHFENIYIFKRPAMAVSSTRVKPAASPAAAEPVDEATLKKQDQENEKAMKKADKEKEKAAKAADKEKEKTAKKAEKEAKKAQKAKEKEAKKAEKAAKKAAKSK